MDNKQQVDWATVLNEFDDELTRLPNTTDEQLFEDYPEFNNDMTLLEAAFAYRNTKAAKTYDDATLKSKFPEFFPAADPASVTATTQQQTAPTAQTQQTTTAQPTMQLQPKKPVVKTEQATVSNPYDGMTDEDLQAREQSLIAMGGERKKQLLADAQKKPSGLAGLFYNPAQSISAVQGLSDEEAMSEMDKKELKALRDEMGRRAASIGFDAEIATAQAGKERVQRAAAKSGGDLNLSSAKYLYEKAEEILSAPSKFDDKTGFDSAWQGIKNFGEGTAENLFDRQFFATADLQRNIRLSGLVKKLNSGDELSDSEAEFLNAYVTLVEAQQKRANDLSLGYKIGQGAAESAPFMVDMLLTSGISSVGKKAVVRNIAKKYGKDVAGKWAKWLGGSEGVSYAESLAKDVNNAIPFTRKFNEVVAGAKLTAEENKTLARLEALEAKKITLTEAQKTTLNSLRAKTATTSGDVGRYITRELVETPVQTATMASSWAGVFEDKANYMLGTGETDWNTKDAFRSFGNMYVETLTERAGGKLIDMGLDKVLPISKIWGKRKGSLRVANDYIQSPISETAEEYLGAGINYIRSFNPFYSDESNKELRDEAAQMMTLEGFAQTFGTVLPMSLLGGAYNVTNVWYSTYAYNSARNKITQYLVQNGATPEQAENIMATMEGAETPEQFDDFLSKTVDNLCSIASGKDYHNIRMMVQDYGKAAYRYNLSVDELSAAFASLSTEEQAKAKAEMSQAIVNLRHQGNVKRFEEEQQRAGIHEDGKIYVVTLNENDGETARVVGGDIRFMNDEEKTIIIDDKNSADILHVKYYDLNEHEYKVKQVAPKDIVDVIVDGVDAQYFIDANVAEQDERDKQYDYFPEGSTASFDGETTQIVGNDENGVTVETTAGDVTVPGDVASQILTPEDGRIKIRKIGSDKEEDTAYAIPVDGGYKLLDKNGKEYGRVIPEEELFGENGLGFERVDPQAQPTGEVVSEPTAIEEPAPTEEPVSEAAPEWDVDENEEPVWDNITDADVAARAALSVTENNRDYAKQYISEYLLPAAEKALSDANKLKMGNVTGGKSFMAEKQRVEGAKKAAKAKVDLFKNALLALTNMKSEEELAAEAERQRKFAESAAERAKAEEGKASGSAEERYASAKKVYGRKHSFYTTDGVKRTGRIVVTEKDALTASHNPNDNFAQTEGYPTLEDGRSINDRNYQDPEEQEKVISGGNNLHKHELIVQQKGQILSGNGRKQMHDVATSLGKTQQYIQDLIESEDEYGLPAGTFAQFEDPEVSVELDEEMPLTAATLALFNTDETQRKSATAKAASFTKSLTPQNLLDITTAVKQFETIDDFFKSNKAPRELIGELVKGGVITQANVAELVDAKTGKLTKEGEGFFTAILLGAAFSEDTIRLLGTEEAESLRKKVLKAVPVILENKQLGEYNIFDHINNSVKAVFDVYQLKNDVSAKQKKVISIEDAFVLWTKQLTISGEAASAEYSAFEVILADALIDGGVTEFTDLIGEYNSKVANEMKLNDGGNGNLFGYETVDSEAIMNQIAEKYGKEETDEQAGAEEPESPVGSKTESGAEEAQIETPAASGEQESEPTAETETGKNAEEQPKEETEKNLLDDYTEEQLQEFFGIIEDYKHSFGENDFDKVRAYLQRKAKMGYNHAEAVLNEYYDRKDRELEASLPAGITLNEWEDMKMVMDEYYEGENTNLAELRDKVVRESAVSEEKATAAVEYYTGKTVEQNATANDEAQSLVGKEFSYMKGAGSIKVLSANGDILSLEFHKPSGTIETKEMKLDDFKSKGYEEIKEQVKTQQESKTEETSAESEVEITEDIIDSTNLPEEIKTLAKGYLNGGRTLLESVAYKKVQDYVRTNAEAAQSSSSNENGTLMGSSDAADVQSGENRGTGRESESVDQQGNEENVPEGNAGTNNGTNDVSVPAGEQGSGEMGGAESGNNSNATDSGNGTRSSGNRSNGTQRTGKRSGGQNGGAVSDSTKGGKTATTTAEDALKQADDDLAAALGDFNSAIDKFKKGSGKLSMSIIGLTNDQIEAVMEMSVASVKIGSALLRKGFYSFDIWSGKMKEYIGEAIKSRVGWTDDELESFINDAWNSPVTYNGETHKMYEWASILNDEEIRKMATQTIADKKKIQDETEKITDAPIPSNLDDIKKHLPFLTPKQQEDIARAETQFFDESHNDRDHGYGKGYLFTNGTGTGKTLTGLGIVKRFQRMGKKRILVVTTTQTKVADWQTEARLLNIDLVNLEDAEGKQGQTATQKKGTGAVVTTYANFSQNKAILEDVFDLVVYDESQHIMANQNGSITQAYNAHRMITNKNKRWALQRVKMSHPLWIKESELNDKIKELEKQAGEFKEKYDQWDDVEDSEFYQEIAKTDEYKNLEKSGATYTELQRFLRGKYNAHLNEINVQIVDIREELRGIQDEQNKVLPQLEKQAEGSENVTKSVFLSATPYNNETGLQYTEGYIFSYYDTDENEDPADKRDGNITDMEAESEKDLRILSKFLTKKFGSKFTSKKGRPVIENKDMEMASIEQVEFTDRLIDELHTMSGYQLDNGYDYSRDFPEASIVMSGQFNAATNEISKLPKEVKNCFPFKDYQKMSMLYEAMKISSVLPRIKEHIGMGRKVAVFVRRTNMTQAITNPIRDGLDNIRLKMNDGSIDKQEGRAIIQEIESKYRDLIEWLDNLDYTLPEEQLKKYFGEDKVGVFNGQQSAKVRKKALLDFNTDNNGMNILLINEDSGKEGLNLQDKTGAHQRVIISLALPQSPITFIQVEGRIFRFGNKSNAIFEYPILGLNEELSAFLGKINIRTEATDNLAFGSSARGLKDAIVEGIMKNRGNVPLAGQGYGQKAADQKKRKRGDSGFDTAIDDYNKYKKDHEGKEEGEGMQSTPEPLGFKMVDWLHVNKNDALLEPSAGHGAVSRYFPSWAHSLSVETDQGNANELTMIIGGVEQGSAEAKGQRTLVRNGRFEDVGTNQKFDGVAMCPPDELAKAHFEKAFTHLNDGGRIVILVKDGSNMLSGYETWSKKTQSAVMVADVTIPNAIGNGEVYHAVVVDKIESEDYRKKAPKKVEIALDESATIEDMFAKIKDIDVPNRTINPLAKIKKQAERFVENIKNNSFVKSSRWRGTSTKDAFAWDSKFTVWYASGRYLRSHYNTASEQNGVSVEYADILNLNKRLVDDYVFWSDAVNNSDDSVVESYCSKFSAEEARTIYGALVNLVQKATGFTDEQLRRHQRGEIDLLRRDNEFLVPNKPTWQDVRNLFEDCNSSNEDESQRQYTQDLFNKVYSIAGYFGFPVRTNHDENASFAAYFSYGRDPHISVNSHYWNKKKNVSNADKASTMLHELIHSISSYALQAYENGAALSPELNRACQQLEATFEAICKSSQVGRIREIGKDKYAFGGRYALENTHEMIAQMSVPEIADFFRDFYLWKREKDGNVVYRGIEQVNEEDAVELGYTKTTAFDELTESLNGFIDNPDEGLWNAVCGTPSMDAQAIDPMSQVSSNLERLAQIDAELRQMPIREAAASTLLEESHKLKAENERLMQISKDEKNLRVTTEAQEKAVEDLKTLFEKAGVNVQLESKETAKRMLESADDTTEFSIRKEAEPKKKGIGYKVFRLGKDGKLYPPMINNPGGKDTPVGVWLNADAAPVVGQSKQGRNKVKNDSGSGTLAYRPGWHLGDIPYALQFNVGEFVDAPNGAMTKKGTPLQVRKYFPKDLVWAEVEYAMDEDYQEEAESYGINEKGNYEHALAGLPRIPENGSYRYRTNPNPATDPWIITGAMKVNKVLSKDEVDDIVRKAGREPQVVEFQDKDGVVYGWYENGTIHLVAGRVNPNTMIHEYTHMWAAAMRDNNADGWESIKKVLKNTPMWEDVKNDPNYESIKDNDDAIASEVLSRYSGSRGSERLVEEEKKLLAKNGTISAAARLRVLMNDVKDAISKFWSWVGKNLFDIKEFNSVDEIADRVLYDLLNGTDLGPDGPGTGSRQIDYPQREPNESQSDYNKRLKEFVDNMKDIGMVRNYAQEVNREIGSDRDLIKGEAAYRKWFDASEPVANFLRYFEKLGGKVKPGMNPYEDMSLAPGRVSTACGQFERLFVRPLAKAISGILGSKKLDGIELTWQNLTTLDTKDDENHSWYRRMFENNDRRTKRRKNGDRLTAREIIGVYAQARDCVEADEQGLPDRGRDGFSNNVGATPEEIIEIVESALGKEEIVNLWASINAATSFALDYELKRGFIDKFTRDKYKERKFYVPQRGWMARDLSDVETDYVHNGRVYNQPYNKALKTADGRSTLASDPFAYIMSIGESSISSAEKNVTLQKFLEYCLDNEKLGLKSGAFRIAQTWIVNDIDPKTGRVNIGEDGNPITKVSYASPSSKQIEHDKEIRAEIDKLTKEIGKLKRDLRNWQKMAEDKNAVDVVREAAGRKAEKMQEKIDAAMNKVEDLENQLYVASRFDMDKMDFRTPDEALQHKVVVIKDGQRYTIWLRSEVLANALNKNYGDVVKDASKTNKALRKGTRLLSALLTQYNPEFALSNFFRDGQVALATLSVEHGAKFAAQATANFAKIQPAVWKYVAAEKLFDEETFANSEYGDYLREYYEHGAQTGYSYLKELDLLKDNFDSMMNEKTLSKAFKKFANALSIATEVSETAVRFAAYVTARENGMSADEAAILSKELTTNFDRGGEISKSNAMSLFSFMRATINGNLKFFKGFKRFAKGYSIAAAAYMVMGLLNALINPDDPDDGVWFTDYARESNFTTGAIFGFTAKIPVAHFLRMFFALGNNIGATYNGRKSAEEAAYDTLSFASDELLPNWMNFGSMFTYDASKGRPDFEWENYVQSAAPSVISPIVDVALNRDFIGRPINGEKHEYRGSENKKDIRKHKKDVPKLYLKITEGIYENIFQGETIFANKMDDNAIQRLADNSPSAIQHVVEGYMPGTAAMLIHIGILINEACEGKEVFADDIPFVRKFYSSYRIDKAYASEYWLLNSRVEAYNEYLNSLIKEEDTDTDEIMDRRYDRYDKETETKIYELYDRCQDILYDIDPDDPTTNSMVKRLMEANKEWNRMQ